MTEFDRNILVKNEARKADGSLDQDVINSYLSYRIPEKAPIPVASNFEYRPSELDLHPNEIAISEFNEIRERIIENSYKKIIEFLRTEDRNTYTFENTKSDSRTWIKKFSDEYGNQCNFSYLNSDLGIGIAMITKINNDSGALVKEHGVFYPNGDFEYSYVKDKNNDIVSNERYTFDEETTDPLPSPILLRVEALAKAYYTQNKNSSTTQDL